MIRRSLLLALLTSQAAFGQSAHPQFDRLSKLRDVSISNPQNTQVLTYDSALTKWKNADATGGGGTGTVTTFSAGNLAPLFTTSVSNATTTPALSFSLSTAGAHTFLGNNTGSTAAPAYVQPAFSDLSGTLDLGGSQASGTLAAAREPAHTGDVTNSAGSLTLTLGNIPDLTTQAGSILATNIAAPTTPVSGKTKIYIDSTSKNIAAKNDAGTVNHGIQTRTAAASNWIRSIADDGSTTISQPAFTDITGTATDAQTPDVLTITRASNLTSNGFVETSGGNGTLGIDPSLSVQAAGMELRWAVNTNGETVIASRNSNTGATADAALLTVSDSVDLFIRSLSSGYTPSGVVQPSTNLIDSDGPLVILTASGTWPIKLAPNFTETLTLEAPASVASGASVKLDDVTVPNLTTTVTGTTNITTATGFNKISFYRPTYTDSSVVAVTRGATVYIENAPAVSGSLTLTNPYALWIDDGIARFDGGLKFTEAAPTIGFFAQSDGTDYDDSAYALPTSAGISGNAFLSNGTNVVSEPFGGVASVTSTVDQTATTETAHITYTVQANSVSAGAVFRIAIYGNMDNGTTAITFTPRVRWGGTAGTQLIAAPTVVSTTTAQVNKGWSAEAYIVIRSIGASGSASCRLSVENHTASGVWGADEADVTPTTIDTTVNKDLVLSWTLSSTTGTPHVRTTGGVIEKVKR